MRFKNLKKLTAATLALTMCFPATAFAGSATAVPMSGDFATTFDLASPVLTVQVPTALDMRVNPLNDTSATTVKKFTFASNSIDIINASVDNKAKGIPVNVKIEATIESKGEGVVTEYNSFTASTTSKEKRVYMYLRQAKTPTELTVGSGAGYTSSGQLDLSKYTLKTTSTDLADYSDPSSPAKPNVATITKWGAVLSMDILAPTLGSGTDWTAGADVVPKVGSFAVVGVANTGASWLPTDVKVKVSYDIKACNPLSLTTPVVAAKTWTYNSADLTFVVENVAHNTVAALGLHNDKQGAYGDYLLELDKDFTVTYAANATTSTQTDATITIKKDNDVMNFLANSYTGKAQDLVIALSDGRMVVTSLTVNKTASSN